MAAVNVRRVWLGTLAGGVVWSVWSTIINGVILEPKYASAQRAGQMLAHPRYPLFIAYWILTLFVATYILTWAYVGVRNTFGPGPKTALRVGFLLGFLAGFPLSLSSSAWAPFSRFIPLGWTCDLWIGAMLATLVSAWIYKEA